VVARNRPNVAASTDALTLFEALTILNPTFTLALDAKNNLYRRSVYPKFKKIACELAIFSGGDLLMGISRHPLYPMSFRISIAQIRRKIVLSRAKFLMKVPTLLPLDHLNLKRK
jgi:hypothetical protein